MAVGRQLTNRKYSEQVPSMCETFRVDFCLNNMDYADIGDRVKRRRLTREEREFLRWQIDAARRQQIPSIRKRERKIAQAYREAKKIIEEGE
jgi:hypothetical protein